MATMFYLVAALGVLAAVFWRQCPQAFSAILCEGEPRSPALFLDHVNLNVERWSPEVERFWMGALGFVSDPRASGVFDMTKAAGGTAEDLVWANIGMQQIHMPVGEPEDSSQKMPNGIVGLVYPNVSLMRARLRSHGVRFLEETVPNRNLNFTYRGRRLFSPTALRLQSPTGVQVRLHQGVGRLAPPGADEVGCKQPGGESLGLGMPYVEFLCRLGASAAICRFYSQVLGVHVEDLGGACRVLMRTGQFLLFRDTSLTVPDYDNHHVAIYIGDPERDDLDTTFLSMYQRCKQAGHVWNNPRFPHLTYDTLEDTRRHNEFRIVDLWDPETGEVVYQLEHEIRSLKHGGFSCKALLPGAAGSWLGVMRNFGRRLAGC